MPEHTRVQPPLRHIPPRFNAPLFRLVAAVYPVYIRFALDIRRVTVEGMDRLLAHYRLFQERKIRLIIAFRHPHLDDGALMARLLGNAVRDAARRERRRTASGGLARPPFAHFVYDRGAPLWAGPFIGWLLPRMGGISVFRGKLDSQSVGDIRWALLHADHPLAIAPEGAVSYNERRAAPLETGVAHFAFWGVRDLSAAGRGERVVILPVVPVYRHGPDAVKGLERLARYLERECGLRFDEARPLPVRLRAIAHHLLSTAETFYRRFYAHSAVVLSPGEEAGSTADAHFLSPERERIEAIVEAALSSAERSLNLSCSGSPIDRVRRVEQACWDRIFRSDIPDIAALSPLERSLADRLARETSLTMRHLQLADIMVYLSELAIPDDAGVDELAEAASNLAGMLARLEGGDISATPRIGSRTVSFRIGRPLSVSERWESYLRNRPAAVEEVMTALREEFIHLSAPQQQFAKE